MSSVQGFLATTTNSASLPRRASHGDRRKSIGAVTSSIVPSRPRYQKRRSYTVGGAKSGTCSAQLLSESALPTRDFALARRISNQRFRAFPFQVRTSSTSKPHLLRRDDSVLSVYITTCSGGASHCQNRPDILAT